MIRVRSETRRVIIITGCGAGRAADGLGLGAESLASESAPSSSSSIQIRPLDQGDASESRRYRRVRHGCPAAVRVNRSESGHLGGGRAGSRLAIKLKPGPTRVIRLSQAWGWGLNRQLQFKLNRQLQFKLHGRSARVRPGGPTAIAMEIIQLLLLLNLDCTDYDRSNSSLLFVCQKEKKTSVSTVLGCVQACTCAILVTLSQ